MSRVSGKAAVVTGGTRGIGLAITTLLLEKGARVHVCGTTQDGLDSALARLSRLFPGRASGTVCDLRVAAEVDRLFHEAAATLGGVDLLVNNAGVGIFRNVEQLSVDEWDTTIGTNLSAVFYCCRAAIPLLKQRGGGCIINIGSLAGKNAFAGGAAYNASKFGLVGFSEALMQEVRYDHIRVSCVMPGSVDTDFGRSRAGDPSTTWKLKPEDVAEVVVGVLEMDPRALPSRIELRPSEPKK
jgi:NAD(P)-dependent dehydrogenase (short-subunit alcohol dehydrogenase family)